MTGVQRAGRVGRHELDHHLGARADIELGVPVDAGSDDRAQDSVQPGGTEVEVHEPGARDLGPLDVGRQVGVEPVDDLLRELAGIAAQALGVGHRDVGGPVAMLASRRFLEVDVALDIDPGSGELGPQGIGEFGADHGDSVPIRRRRSERVTTGSRPRLSS